MNRYTLKLYQSKKCNIKCEYCNLVKDTVELKDDDIVNFILSDDNYYNIDKRNIFLYGGEPTIIYSDELLLFLKKYFYKVTIISNFHDVTNISRIVNILGTKAQFLVSLNPQTNCFENVTTFSKYVSGLNVVLTNTNYDFIERCINFANSIGIELRISTENTSITYEYDYSKLSEIMNRVFAEHKEYLIANYHDVRRGGLDESTKYYSCVNSTIIISNTGNIFTCEYCSDLYDYKNVQSLGHISTFKLSEYNPNVDTSNNGCVSKHQAIFDTRKESEFKKWFHNFVTTYDYIMVPHIVLLFLTEQCNLKCQYCFEGTKKNSGLVMSKDIIRKYINYAWLNSSVGSPINVLLFGGEPTLEINSIRYIGELYNDLISTSTHKGCLTFTINTNLINLGDDVLDTLVWFADTVKNFDISVSLDGCKEMQDRRFADSYENVLNNVSILRSALKLSQTDSSRVGDGVTISKSSTIMVEDYNYIIDAVENMIKELNLFDMFTVGYATDCQNVSTSIESENMFKCYQQVEMILDKCKNSELFPKIYEYISQLSFIKYFGAPKIDCGAFSYYLTIKADGSIIPCHSCFGLNSEHMISPTEVSNDNKIHIQYGTTLFHFYNKIINEFDRGYIDIVSDATGESCRDCKYFNFCSCIKHTSLDETSVFKRSVDECMRTLEQVEIFLDFLKIENDAKLRELENIEFNKMKTLDEGMQKLASTQSVIMDIGEILVNGISNE